MARDRSIGPARVPAGGTLHYNPSMRAPSERQTRQRQAIRDAIADAGTPLSPREVFEHAQTRVEGLGMATVYRTLRLLVESGIIVPVEIPGDSPRFELTGKGHHHHFFCRRCERVFEVDGCPGDFATLAPKGFTLDGHELVLFGTCASCGPGSPSTSCPVPHKHGRSCRH